MSPVFIDAVFTFAMRRSGVRSSSSHHESHETAHYIGRCSALFAYGPRQIRAEPGRDSRHSTRRFQSRFRQSRRNRQSQTPCARKKKTAQHQKAMSGQDRRVTTTTCAYMGLRMRKSIRGRPEPLYTKTPKNQTTPISLAPISSSILRTRRRPLTARFACQP